MSHLWRWLASLGSGAAVLVLSRWIFGLGRVADDARRVRGFVGRLGGLVVRPVRALWLRYGPPTQPVLDAWAQLRRRYQAGGYGVQGT